MKLACIPTLLSIVAVVSAWRYRPRPIKNPLAVYNEIPCGNAISKSQQVIRAPLDAATGKYKNKENCCWPIASNTGSVSFEFLSVFDVENGGPRCRYDYVQLLKANGSPVSQKICNSWTRHGLPADLHVQDPDVAKDMQLCFSTDSSVVKKGFAVRVSFDSPVEPRPEPSPRPSPPLPGDVTTMPPPRPPTMPPSPPPTMPPPTMPPPTMPPPPRPPTTIPPTTTTIVIIDSILEFMYAETACGSGITTDAIIRLPLINGVYENNMDCCWNIFLPADIQTHVHLQFLTFFSVEPDAQCDNDYLELTAGNGDSLAKVCGWSGLPADIDVSSAASLRLCFHSNDGIAGGGFAVQVSFWPGSTPGWPVVRTTIPATPIDGSGSGWLEEHGFPTWNEAHSPMPGTHGGPMPGTHGGPMPGPHGGPMPGTHGGPMPEPHGGPMHGTHGGPMPGMYGGPMPGTHGGPMPGMHGGPMPGPHDGPMPGTHGGPMPGLHGGPMHGTHGGPMAGPHGGPMPGPHGGPMPGTHGGPMPGTHDDPIFGPHGDPIRPMPPVPEQPDEMGPHPMLPLPEQPDEVGPRPMPGQPGEMGPMFGSHGDPIRPMPEQPDEMGPMPEQPDEMGPMPEQPDEVGPMPPMPVWTSQNPLLVYRPTPCGTLITADSTIRLPTTNGQYENNMVCCWDINAPSDTITTNFHFLTQFDIKDSLCTNQYLELKGAIGETKAKLCGELGDQLPYDIDVHDTPVMTLCFHSSDDGPVGLGFAVQVSFQPWIMME